MSYVAFCHNALCEVGGSSDPAIRLHMEAGTGAWVPDACPACREDLHGVPLADMAELPLATLLGLTNRELSDYDVLELLTAVARDVARQDERRRRQLAAAPVVFGPETECPV